jgi:hypothetical protein
MIDNKRHNVGIGVEKEILSSPYFSYHYGYKEAKSCKYSKKICRIENTFFPYLRKVPFNIAALNVSKKGNFIFIAMKNESDKELFEKKLKIKLINNTTSFAINVDDLEKDNKVIRQLYTNNSPSDFSFSCSTNKIVENLISKFDSHLVCFGLNSFDENLYYDDIHLELYPKYDTQTRNSFIKELKNYVNDILFVEKYIYDLKRFSHLKFRIKNEEIVSIKYYRSVNVDIPDYYAS